MGMEVNTAARTSALRLHLPAARTSSHARAQLEGRRGAEKAQVHLAGHGSKHTPV